MEADVAATLLRAMHDRKSADFDFAKEVRGVCCPRDELGRGTGTALLRDRIHSRCLRLNAATGVHRGAAPPADVRQQYQRRRCMMRACRHGLVAIPAAVHFPAVASCPFSLFHRGAMNSRLKELKAALGNRFCPNGRLPLVDTAEKLQGQEADIVFILYAFGNVARKLNSH